MWLNGVPAGYGSMVDQHTDHYEGVVSFKKDTTTGTILCDGEGTYTVGGEPVTGTFGMGNLKIAADKDKQSDKLICSFTQGYKDIDYKGITTGDGSETDFNNKIAADQTTLSTTSNISPLPTLQYVSYLTTGKPVLKTDHVELSLNDGSKYYGQTVVDKSKASDETTAVGFGYYQPAKVGGVTNTYIGQWAAGVPSGWGLLVQYHADKSTSVFRGQFLKGVPAGQGTGWNWDKDAKLVGKWVGTAAFSKAAGASTYNIAMTKCQQYFDTNGEVSCSSLESDSKFKNYPIYVNSSTATLGMKIDVTTVNASVPAKKVVAPTKPAPAKKP